MIPNPHRLDMLRNVDVRLSVELGRAQLKLKDILALEPDSVVPLDRLTDELLDILVNGQPIGKAEIVAQGDRFAMRVVTLLADGDGADSGVPDPAFG